MLFRTALCPVRRTALGRFRFLPDVMHYGSSSTDLRRGKSEEEEEERKGKSARGWSTASKALPQAAWSIFSHDCVTCCGPPE